MIKRFFFNWFYRVVRWILGIVFIGAGSLKLWDPRAFAVLIEAYGFIPDAMLYPVAVVLPALEVLAGLGLLFDIKGSLAVIAGLLGCFIAILGYGIWLGLDVDCGCFGPNDPESKAYHGLRTAFLRDLFMVAGVVFLYAWRRYGAIAPVGINVMKIHS